MSHSRVWWWIYYNYKHLIANINYLITDYMRWVFSLLHHWSNYWNQHCPNQYKTRGCRRGCYMVFPYTLTIRSLCVPPAWRESGNPCVRGRDPALLIISQSVWHSCVILCNLSRHWQEIFSFILLVSLNEWKSRNSNVFLISAAAEGASKTLQINVLWSLSVDCL